MEAVDAFYAGMAEAAAPHAVAVVGGDTSASPGGWMVNVTLLGVHPGAPRLRSDARPGDAVAVTGSLGRSAAGLYALEVGPDRARATGLAPGALADIVAAHLRPRARVAEGRWLGEAAGRARDDGLLRRARHRSRAHLPGERRRRPREARPPAGRRRGPGGGPRPRHGRARLGGRGRRGLRAAADLRAGRGGPRSPPAWPRPPEPRSRSSVASRETPGAWCSWTPTASRWRCGAATSISWIARVDSRLVPELIGLGVLLLMLRPALGRRGRLLLARPAHAAQGARRAAGPEPGPLAPLLAQPHELLVTLLVGITVVNIGASALAAAIAEQALRTPGPGHRHRGHGVPAHRLRRGPADDPGGRAPAALLGLGEPAGGVALGPAEADPGGARRASPPSRLRLAGSEHQAGRARDLARRSCAPWWTWARARAWSSAASAR